MYKFISRDLLLLFIEKSSKHKFLEMEDLLLRATMVTTTRRFISKENSWQLLGCIRSKILESFYLNMQRTRHEKIHFPLFVLAISSRYLWV